MFLSCTCSTLLWPGAVHIFFALLCCSTEMRAANSVSTTPATVDFKRKTGSESDTRQSQKTSLAAVPATVKDPLNRSSVTPKELLELYVTRALD